MPNSILRRRTRKRTANENGKMLSNATPQQNRNLSAGNVPLTASNQCLADAATITFVYGDMVMRWLVGAVLVLLISLVVYVGSAVWSVKSLAEAAQSGNGPEIIARSDLPRVKRSLVDQIVRAYLERQGAKRPRKPMELMLANTYGASIADALVGKMLTEENLTKLLRSGVVTEGLPNAQMPALAALDISDTFTVLRRLSPVKIVEFAIALGNDASSGAISLHFEGNGWKLSGVNLPAEAVRALAETLPIK
jgi:hypothetical protein